MINKLEITLCSTFIITTSNKFTELFWRQFPLNILLLFTLQAPDCHVKGLIKDMGKHRQKYKSQVSSLFLFLKKGYYRTNFQPRNVNSCENFKLEKPRKDLLKCCGGVFFLSIYLKKINRCFYSAVLYASRNSVTSQRKLHINANSLFVN